MTIPIIKAFVRSCSYTLDNIVCGGIDSSKLSLTHTWIWGIDDFDSNTIVELN